MAQNLYVYRDISNISHSEAFAHSEALARVVMQAPRSSSVTALRHELHWLPVRQRIVFKLVTLTFKAKQFGNPAYLSDLLHEYQPVRTFRSSSA